MHGGPRCPAVFIDGRQVENLLEGRLGVNNLFTPPFNLHIALSLADKTSKASREMTLVQWLHGERQNPHSTARRVTCRDESSGPSDRRFGDRIGIKTRLGRIPMGRWWRGLNVLIVGHDTGAIRRTLDRILILEVSASAALLSACSGHCYVAGASPAANSEARRGLHGL